MRHFVPFLLALLILALLLRVAVFVTVVYFLITLYVLSRLWVRHAIAHVAIDRSLLNRAFQGDVVDVTVSARNTSRVPIPWIELRDSVPVDLRSAAPPAHVISLGQREEASFTYRLNASKRGYYTIGPIYLATGDLIGIDRRNLIWNRDDPFIVYPRIVPLERIGLGALAPHAALPTPSPLIEDPARVLGVRDYQAGDSPRRMHWTATARLSKLVVRQYEPTISRETMIFLDLDGNHYEAPYGSTELAISAAASIANHIVTRNNLPVGLAVEARDPLAEGRTRRFSLAPRPGRGHLLSVLEILARVELLKGGEFARTLQQGSVSLPRGATIIVITGSAPPELLAVLLYLRRGGFAVSLVLVGPYVTADDTGGLVRTYPVRWYEDLELLA